MITLMIGLIMTEDEYVDISNKIDNLEADLLYFEQELYCCEQEVASIENAMSEINKEITHLKSQLEEYYVSQRSIGINY